jgi:nitrilase
MADFIVRAAVAQAAPAVFDTRRTLAKLKNIVGEAASQRADIVVFPEAFVGGYPKGLDFGARLGMRSAAGREDFRRYYEGAIAVPGPETDEIGRAARQNRVHLVVGVIELMAGRSTAPPSCTPPMAGCSASTGS